MKFAAIIEYTNDKETIAKIRPLHREYLKNLMDQGNLAASGPFTDDSGALIIYETDSAEKAEEFVKADPFCQNGVFVSWKIRPWNPVMVNPQAFAIAP